MFVAINVLVVAIILSLLLMWFAVVVHIAQAKRFACGDRTTWMLLVLLLNLAGAVIYLLFGFTNSKSEEALDLNDPRVFNL